MLFLQCPNDISNSISTVVYSSSRYLTALWLNMTVLCDIVCMLKFHKLSYLADRATDCPLQIQGLPPLSPAKEHLARHSQPFVFVFSSSFVFGHLGTHKHWQCLCAIRKHWETFSAVFMELDPCVYYISCVIEV